jgi:hypothetical protein
VNPFRISCTTCRARLKIVDPAAVDQILACPKCGSLVQAAPPPGWSPDEPAAAGGAAQLETAKLGNTGSSTIILKAGATAPLPGSRPDTLRETETAAATAKQSVSAPPPRVEPPPLPADVTAAAEGTARWFWPALSAATVLSVAVAALLIYLDRKNHADQVAATEPAIQQSNPAADKSSPLIQPPESKPADANPAESASPKAAEKPAERARPAAAPANPPPAVAEATAASANRKPSDQPVAAVTPAPMPQGAPKSADPLPAAATEDKPPIPPAGNPAAAQSDPSPLTDPLAGPKGAPPRQSPIDPPPGRIARPSVERVPPRDVDVQSHLTNPVAGVNYKQVPLVQLLAELNQWSAIPITLDADALRELSITPDVPITVSVKETTIAGVLEEVLSPLELSYSVVGHQLLIGRPRTDELRRVRYNVADLAGDTPEGMNQFAALIHAMVDPASWKDGPGTGVPSGPRAVPAAGSSRWSDGALVVEQHESAHAQMLVFCEKLRLARGLPLRSKLDPARFSLEPRTATAKAMLSRPVTVNFGRPEPLARMLAYLQSSTQTIFLVDQVALAEQRTSVETGGLLVANRQPLDQALTALVEPMDLAWRVVGNHAIEITTPQAAAQHADVEFYRIAELLSGEAAGQQLIGRIERELASAAASDPSSAPATIHLDAPSRSLIVRAPQSVQLRVAALLGAWRVARQ